MKDERDNRPQTDLLWPTSAQQLLLKGALTQGDTAIQAWKAWHAKIDWSDHLDQDSYRLTPLLYYNLSQHQVKDPIMGKLKGIYRMTWYKNTTALRGLASALQAMLGSKIATMLIKESASIVGYYPNIGLRLLNRLDLIVPKALLPNAIECLDQIGWTLDQRHARRPMGILLATEPALVFVNAEKQTLHLHWQVLRGDRVPQADLNFWQDGIATQINGVSTSILCAENHLLQVCTDSQSSPVVGSIAWVADAMMVLRSSASTIDWQRLLIQAQDRLLVVPLRDSLEYLHASFAAPIPAAALDKLRDRAISRMERWETRYLASGYQHRPWADIPYFWFDYLRSRDLSRNENKLSGFVRYLYRRSEAPSLWQLPIYLTLACARRIKRSFIAE